MVRLGTFVDIHSVVFEKWNGKRIAFALGLLDDSGSSGAEHEKCRARRTLKVVEESIGKASPQKVFSDERVVVGGESGGILDEVDARDVRTWREKACATEMRTSIVVVRMGDGFE